MKTGKSQFLRRIAWLLLASMLLSFAACSQAPIIQSPDPTDPTDPPVFIEPPIGEREVKLKNYNVLGQWQNSRVTATGEDSSVGPARSQDFNIYTKWNPQVLAGYEGEPGIEYELDRAYDVNKFVFTFASNYYFDLYVSTDGQEDTLVAAITADNAKYAYDEGVCTLEGLQLTDIRFVKLMFTGHASNNLWISLSEVEFFETGATDLDTSWMLPESEKPTDPPAATDPSAPTAPTTPVTGLVIEDYQVVGAFRDDRVWDDGHSDAGLGPHLTVDGKTTTYWNPCAEDQYAGEPGIIYTLNGWYDLTQITLTFGKADMSFVVYGSSHGEVYTELAKVDAENIGRVYADKTATLTLAGEAVRYVKIVFTGRPSNQLWIFLYEVALTGEGVEEPEYVAPPATEPPTTEPPTTEPPTTEPPTTEPPATEPAGTVAPITAHKITGSFANNRLDTNGDGDKNTGPQLSCDGNTSTRWNPAANGGFTDEPGIIYTLDGWYDLTKVELTFGAADTYFIVYGSADGKTYQELAVVNKDNMIEFYNGATAVVPVNGEAIRYVKVILTGRASSTWIAFYETVVYGFATTEPDSTVETVDAVVTDHQVIGEFVYSRVYSDGSEDKNVGPQLSHDGVNTTQWNPQVNSGYSGEPGIIYTLDDAYDLTLVSLTAGAKKIYFKVYGSTDGDSYQELADINANNFVQFYTGSVATVDIAGDDIRYVKIVLTGRTDGQPFVSLCEIKFAGVKAG